MGYFFDNWVWVHRSAWVWGMVFVLARMLAWALWETSVERVEYHEVAGQLPEAYSN